MKTKIAIFLAGSIILGLALIILLRCGGGGEGGGIPASIGPSSARGYIDGVVYDSSDDRPLEGAKVAASGVSGSVQSDGEGKFFFPITKNREYILTIGKPGYTFAQRRARGVVEGDVAVDPVYLIPLDPSVTSIAPEGGTHRDSTGRIEIVFPPGAVSKPVEVRATMVEKGRDLPYPLPLLSKFTVAFHLTPEGLTLKKPARIRVKNFLGFPPGTPVPVGIYTQKSAQWVAAGMGVITTHNGTMEIASNNDTVMEYEVERGGYQDLNFPVFPPEDAGVMQGIKDETPERVHRCEEGGKHGSGKVGLKTGNIYLVNGLPRYRSLGVWRGVALEYNSLSARPGMVIAAEAELDSAEVRIPETIGFYVSIEGRREEVKFEGGEGKARFGYLFDGRNARGELLATGSYRFRVEITSDYRGNYYTAAFFGGPPLDDTGVSSREPVPLRNYFYSWLPLHNESQSPYGSGWGVRGLQRLHIGQQGESFLVTEGSIYAGVFVPVGTYRVMNPACVVDLTGIGVDGKDRVYFTGEHRVWRWNPDGTLTVVAGTGEFGFDGDGGHATEAKLWSPMGVAFDLRGNMYIADEGNNRVRKVNRRGIITTVAGSGEPGFGGDGGHAVESRLFSPTGVALDSSGNLYIADSLNNRIRTVDRKGIITTYAGSGPSGFHGDGGLATEAQLYWPRDIALDSEGNLFIADTQNNRIRKVGKDGIITTVAGTGSGGFSGNGGYAVNAQIWHPYDVAVDGEGNLYIADFENYRIRKVDRRGIIDTWVGGGTGETVDGTPSTEAYIFPPLAVAMDSQDTLYIGQLPRFGRCYPIGKVNYHIPGGPHVVLFKSPRGDFTKLRQNADLTFTRTLKDGTEIHFDQKGLHVRTVDLNGNITLYGYDEEDRLETITDPRGRVIHFEYENRGKLSRIIDPAGRETRFEVDEAGDLVAIENPDETVTRFKYRDHLITSSTDPRGYTTDFQYDSKYGRLTEVRYPTGEIRSFSHSDIKGLINDLPPGTGVPENPAPKVRPVGIRDTFTDGERKTWSFRTDRFGRIIEREDPIGRVTLIERDLDSLPTRFELPNGEVFRITWDARGNPIVIRQESIDAMTTFSYYPIHNRVQTIRDAEYHTSHFEYDDNGNLTDFWDAEGKHYRLTYHDGGLLKTVINPLQKTTSFTHDEFGNLWRVTDPLGHITTFGYDNAGNIESVTDANYNATGYRYDVMNRLIEVIDAEGNTTGYAYEGGCPGCGGFGGLLSSITDASGNTTTFTYDEVGQLKEGIQPMGQRKTFEYYLNRNIKSITTPRGDLISFIYDEAGQLIEKRLPEGTIYYDYDDAGNLTHVANEASIIDMVYDLAGRLRNVKTSLTPHQPAITIGYEYDKVGNRISMNDGTTTTTYVYDKTDRLTDLVSPSGQTGYTHDGLGRRENVTMPNGIVATYSYDDAGRLVNLTNEGVSRFDYTHDGVGNRLSMTTGEGAHGYSYDNIHQLTEATHPASLTETFTYDDVGNRLSSAEYPTWTYDANNRLTGYNGTTYTYDENGNMTTKTDADGTTTYAYDSENRLISITDPQYRVTTYDYDGLGRRIEKNANGDITRYTYDLEDILYEYDGLNNITARFTHGPGIDDPIVMEREGESYFYHTDGLRSITHLTDFSKQTVGSYTYNAFGDITSKTGSVSNSYTFTGREYDPESGFYYYRARYYDPKIGRFLSGDPIGFLGKSQYVYVGNRPTRAIDPWGLWGEDVHSGIDNIDYGTYVWAIGVGFSDSQARKIAHANYSTDGGFSSWWPVIGQQSRHFNQIFGIPNNYSDSQDYWAEIEIKRAVRYAKRGECGKALGHLGKGLHSIQDKFAHRDWSTGMVGTIRHPDWYDIWNDPRNELARSLTEKETIEYLLRYLKTVGE